MLDASLLFEERSTKSTKIIQKYPKHKDAEHRF